MNAPSTHDITQLLRAWGEGDEGALDKLTPLVYRELHQVAKRYMAREPSDQTLQTTALINEVYVRLVNFREISWQNRAHFFAVCARLMRRILTDFARSRRYLKRGGAIPHVSLEEASMASKDGRADFAALDEALNRLGTLDFRKSKVVELRFFGGLSVEETAEVLKVSSDTVEREWKMAKLWLSRQLAGEGHDGS